MKLKKKATTKKPKKIRKKKTYIVYKIEFEGKIVYYGHTSNLKLRQYRHNYDCFTNKMSKILYNYLRDKGCRRIELTPIIEYNSRVDTKRHELYLILQDYFNNNLELTVKQSIPKISDF